MPRSTRSTPEPARGAAAIAFGQMHIQLLDITNIPE
jgi:hypothetical protein